MTINELADYIDVNRESDNEYIDQERGLPTERGEKMKECCGNCKYNKRDFSKPQGKGYVEFCCGNEDSEEYGVPTFFDDTCDDFEEKDRE